MMIVDDMREQEEKLQNSVKLPCNFNKESSLILGVSRCQGRTFGFGH